MQVKLNITAGPHLGKEFVFDKRDSFLVGRSISAHFQLSDDDPYFSRKHFVIEINPPRCRLIDMKSLNGIKVNGKSTTLAELNDGDVIQGGTTIFKLSIIKPTADHLETITLDSQAHSFNSHEILYQFEKAFKDGKNPVPEAFLVGEGEVRRRLLVELLRSDIELRLRAGQNLRVKDYLAKYPDLAQHPADLLSLVSLEHRQDQHTGPYGNHDHDADVMPAIPGFQLVKVLGKGGMGVVYHCIRLQDQRPTAIKIIHPAAGANRKSIAQFFREAEILSQLNHHRIVRLLESGEHEGVLYLAMEYVDGKDAHQLVKEDGPQKISIAVRMICQALSGLMHAHAQGYVHRDIKPSNLLIGTVNGKRELKVADFGLARAFESSQLSGLTLQGEMGGTPAFMPPEQITHYRDVKPAADQYSTAAALYYLLTGEYLFDFPKDLGGKLTKILAEPPVPIQERCGKIPGTLAEVINKALMKEPKDRYPDASTFRAALIPFA